MRLKTIGLICGIFGVVLSSYLLISLKMEESKQLEANKQVTLQREMFKLGASMYRSQVINTYGDSIIFPVDSLFIKEVFEFNDTLGHEIEGVAFEN